MHENKHLEKLEQFSGVPWLLILPGHYWGFAGPKFPQNVCMSTSQSPYCPHLFYKDQIPKFLNSQILAAFKMDYEFSGPPIIPVNPPQKDFLGQKDRPSKH
ncbi:MAG: hypothetical protein ACI4UF_10040 [Thermoguttaceae bacterium]